MTALSSARQTSNRHRSARTAPSARAARRMDDCSGRSPDLRLIARFSAFPRPEAQWLSWKRANRLQLRAQLRIWLRTYETSPHSHLVDLSINEPELHNLRGNFAVVKAAGSSFLVGTGTADLGLGSFATGPASSKSGDVHYRAGSGRKFRAASNIVVGARRDRGYDADWIRELARQQGAWANIPPKRNRQDPICFSPYLYGARNVVERSFNKIKQCASQPDMTNSRPTIWRSSNINPNSAACK